MPIVTAVKPQKNGKRVNIYLDGEFSFGIDLDNFVILGLKVGKEYSQDEIEKIIKKAGFQKTLDKLLRFATLRPRSEKEITLYLKRKKVHESLFDELFNRLKRLELLNDEQFAQWWVDQRIQFKSKSIREITQELLQKGISKDIVEEIIFKSQINDETSAKKTLHKYAYKWDKYDKRTKIQKEREFLLRKGFSWEVAKKLTEE